MEATICERVRLRAKTHKAKNRLAELAARDAGWNGVWRVTAELDTIQAKAGSGPWLLVVPDGVSVDHEHQAGRWVHRSIDQDFEVQTA